ncbi:MAG TPA: glycosyltransferase 87 family protein [Candidatus Solibacter sp.]|nr:glycosyltransferase 87 family protein [Candidatus Solibacter sp.]
MAFDTNPAAWINAKRLRAHATILGVCLWSVFVWNLATPSLRDRAGHLKGTDFLHFYILGSIALTHEGMDLYDMKAQAALAAERVPEATGIQYLPLYPPQVSILFAPLAHLPYGFALTVWWLLTSAIYGICCYSVWTACPHLRSRGGTVAIISFACPAFFHLIAWGQTSALALACFTLMFFLLRDKRDFLAGLVMGCLIFKPQLGVAAAVVLIAIGAWRTLIAAALSASFELATGVLYYGWEPLCRWFGVLWNVRAQLSAFEPRLYQTHALRTFWSMLLPWPDLALAAFVFSGFVVLGLTIAVWRHRQAHFALRYSSLLLATVLDSPHLTVYDLVVLAPAILLLADWIAGQQPCRSNGFLAILLYAIYALPLVGPLALWTHVQLSVVAMVAVVFLIWRTSARSLPAENKIEEKQIPATT